LEPLPKSNKPKATLMLADGSERRDIELSAKPSQSDWAGWFQGRMLLPKAGDYKLELPIPSSSDVLRAKFTVRESNPELDNTRPDPAALMAMAGDLDEIQNRIKNPAALTELRQRLEITGELAPASGLSDVFDATLSEAVRKFQKQHNLPQSGFVDRRTLLALNIPVRDRVAQLMVNLERWRWFEDIPKGELWVINTNAARLEIRQADGKQEQIGLKVDNACEQSPALDSTIDHVEVAPTFMFPASLAARYFLPVLQSKPDSLDPSLVIYAESSLAGIQNVDWKTYSEANFPFSVTQSPGRTNLLGLFQISLKDEGAVSIHGRPSPDPKLAIPRTLWPACVALLGPTEKAEILLKRIGVDVSISSGEGGQTPTRRIDLPSSIPVVFLYATVWTDPVNGVVFGPDPLSLDGDLARKLSKFSGS
jgi:murein L,D-transpeptidase YcbB/YkuD